MLIVGDDPSVAVVICEEVVVCWPVVESRISMFVDELPLVVVGVVVDPVLVGEDVGVVELEVEEDWVFDDEAGFEFVCEDEVPEVDGVVGFPFTW